MVRIPIQWFFSFTCCNVFQKVDGYNCHKVKNEKIYQNVKNNWMLQNFTKIEINRKFENLTSCWSQDFRNGKQEISSGLDSSRNMDWNVVEFWNIVLWATIEAENPPKELILLETQSKEVTNKTKIPSVQIVLKKETVLYLPQWISAIQPPNWRT